MWSFGRQHAAESGGGHAVKFGGSFGRLHAATSKGEVLTRQEKKRRLEKRRRERDDGEGGF